MTGPRILALAVAHLNKLKRALTEDQPEDDGKPCACRFCGGHASVEHIMRGRERYAQVLCFRCDVRGPAVRFDLSDEWPHIAAEQIAIAKGDAMQWAARKRAD